MRGERGEAGESLGTEDLVSGIPLGVFNGTTERGGKEQNIVVPQNLFEVVVEIACFLFVVEDDKRGER